MSKKTTTTVTKTRNGGIHDVRAYRKACQWLDNHTFTNGQLWHVVFKGSNGVENLNREDYTVALDRLCEKLRDAGMPVEWKAAYEQCPTKGHHRHVFLLVEATDRKPVGIIRNRKGGWLTNMLAGFNLECWVARPQNAIHKTRKGHPKRYAYVPKTPGAMLDDCKEWLSYAFKARTKEGVVGPIYSSSRKKAKKATAKALDPATVVAATTNEEQQTGDTMTPTTLAEAAFIHVGAIYEDAIDAGMHLGEVQQHLGKHGIHKPMLAIKNELNNLYCFYGYADSHPEPRVMSYAEVDAVLAKSGRRSGKQSNRVVHA